MVFTITTAPLLLFTAGDMDLGDRM